MAAHTTLNTILRDARKTRSSRVNAIAFIPVMTTEIASEPPQDEAS
jgi:hypothetical protein